MTIGVFVVTLMKSDEIVGYACTLLTLESTFDVVERAARFSSPEDAMKAVIPSVIGILDPSAFPVYAVGNLDTQKLQM